MVIVVQSTAHILLSQYIYLHQCSDVETESDHEEEESDNVALRRMTNCSSDPYTDCSEAECFDMD